MFISKGTWFAPNKSFIFSQNITYYIADYIVVKIYKTHEFCYTAISIIIVFGPWDQKSNSGDSCKLYDHSFVWKFLLLFFLMFITFSHIFNKGPSGVYHV